MDGYIFTGIMMQSKRRAKQKREIARLAVGRMAMGYL